MDYSSLFNEIPHSKEWIKIEPFYKGWSDDKKFYIEDINGVKYLLRVNDIEKYDKKKLEFDRLKIVFKTGIPMSKPIDFGTFNHNKSTYTLLNWIDGEDAEQVLPTLSEEKQYQLGIQAGQILHKIHSAQLPPTTDNQVPWEKHYNQKIDRLIDKYYNCGANIDNEENIIGFIKENAKYLKSRHRTYQHGDYHIGNMIFTPKEEIAIIDFNRSSVGDPWEEYDRFIFTWEKSIPFANGQIHGYFNHNVPDDFFRLMSLYNATNIIASIPWAIPFGEVELKTIIRNAELILDSYNGFTTYKPIWYKDPQNKN